MVLIAAAMGFKHGSEIYCDIEVGLAELHGIIFCQAKLACAFGSHTARHCLEREVCEKRVGHVLTCLATGGNVAFRAPLSNNGTSNSLEQCIDGNSQAPLLLLRLCLCTCSYCANIK